MHTNKFLGFQYKQENGKIILHQSDYIEDIIKRFGMWDANTAPTPIAVCQKDLDSTPFEDNTRYREAVGALQYAASQTRLDIAFTVGRLGRKLMAPTMLDWQILKRTLRYLRGTINLGICYENTGINTLIAFPAGCSTSSLT